MSCVSYGGREGGEEGPWGVAAVRGVKWTTAGQAVQSTLCPQQGALGGPTFSQAIVTNEEIGPQGVSGFSQARPLDSTWGTQAQSETWECRLGKRG